MGNIWRDQYFYSIKWISASINQKLKNQFLKKDTVISTNSVKGSATEFLKTAFVSEKYLNTPTKKIINILVKFTTSNHRLMIGVGIIYIAMKESAICVILTKMGTNFIISLLECNA